MEIAISNLYEHINFQMLVEIIKTIMREYGKTIGLGLKEHGSFK